MSGADCKDARRILTRNQALIKTPRALQNSNGPRMTPNGQVEGKSSTGEPERQRKVRPLPLSRPALPPFSY